MQIRMKMKQIILFSFLSCFILTVGGFVRAFPPQEAKINQKKIDKQREKKAKEAQKEYDRAVKAHYDHQSKETKKMMKQAKKDSKKNTPLNQKK
jgi:Na+-transporting methylmalonyl-CoA/oxaloacetate decarboxylase gamma subunit